MCVSSLGFAEQEQVRKVPLTALLLCHTVHDLLNGAAETAQLGKMQLELAALVRRSFANVFFAFMGQSEDGG